MKNLPLEEAMVRALERQLPTATAKSYEIRYFAMKEKLYSEVLEWIRSKEPSLTDHSAKHVDNLLNNIYKLIPEEIENAGNAGSALSGADVYFLAVTALFHDVGNLFGRERHNQTAITLLNEKFDSFFQEANKREKILIYRAARAHTGKGEDTSADTLKDLEKREQLNGEPIRFQDIAAIVRFADELVEGPQRTSSYALSKGIFDPASSIYHRYASTTHIHIDPKNERISIAYEIEINTDSNHNILKEEEESLRELLNFIHERIYKLDAERKYCSFYCTLLSPIKKIVANFSFHNNGLPIDFKVEPLTLNDLVVPTKHIGDHSKKPHGRDDLSADIIIEKLKIHLKS